MEYPLAILAPLSACYLLHSYWTPSFAPNGVTKLVQYKYLASANEVSALTVSGGCYIGEEKVPCCTLDLGTCLTKLKPWLAVFPIFYGLVLLGTIFVLLYAAAAKRTSTNRERLAELRTFVLVVLVLATLAGVAGTAVGCVLLLLPLLDANLSEVIYVDAGWAQLVTIGTTVLTGMLALGFYNHSAAMLEDLGGGITLSEQAELEAQTPLLGEKGTEEE